jgi:acetyl-CoA C-acetyltransferase
VLVGVGLVMQRQEEPLLAKEPLDLMVDAVVAAGHDCGHPALLRHVDRVHVPKGRWRYRDPGRAIAGRIGALSAVSLLAKVGVLQETLVADACQRIAAGEIRAALVVGGEAGHRLARARVLGRDLEDTQQESTPDETLRPAGTIVSDAERAGGLGDDAVGYYAVIDSAFRASAGTSLERYRDEVAARYSGFSRIASANPHAWNRSIAEPGQIRNATLENPMLAFPYTRLHTSTWSVDQATALLLCSVATARQLAIDERRWVFPIASAVSEHMVHVSERERLDSCPGADGAARAALDHACLDPGELHFVDLYSCFPVAVAAHARAVGIDEARPLTCTGGMRFAGGPFNNYTFHATAQLAQHLRRAPGARGLVSCVSGVLTKHGFGIWGTGRERAAYASADVTERVSASAVTKRVVTHYAGPGTIAGYTVLHDGGRPDHAVAVVDIDDGRRTIARSSHPAVLRDMTQQEFYGRTVDVVAGLFALPARVSP